MPVESGAPYGGAALMRRTRVFVAGETWRRGNSFAPSISNETGGAALWAAKPKKKNSRVAALLFGTTQHYRCYGLQVCTQNQIEAQRSGVDLERGRDKMSER